MRTACCSTHYWGHKDADEATCRYRPRNLYSFFLEVREGFKSVAVKLKRPVSDIKEAERVMVEMHFDALRAESTKPLRTGPGCLMTESEAWEYIESKPSWIALSTNGHDGFPHTVPIGYFVSGGSIFIGCLDSTQRSKMLKGIKKSL